MNNSQKKKVLIFVPEFPRLTETFIQREISQLIKFDHLDITVFSIQKASGELFDNVKEHIVYRRLNFVHLFSGIIYFLLNHPRKVLKVYWEFLMAPEGNKITKTAFFLKSLGYSKIFLEYSPDHIHANFMSWPSTMVMIASQVLGVDYSVSAHAKDVMVEGEFIPAKVETAEFIAICNKFAFMDCVKRSGKDNPANVLLMYHGVDPERAFNVDHSAIEKKSIPVLFNGGSRLVEKKGQKYLIEAAHILKEEGYAFELHIAGPGPLYEDLCSQIDRLGLGNNVFIHGNGEGVPFETVVAYLEACDLVVQSNINIANGDADGVPTFVIEAAFMGKPIVATDAGSITDLIVNEKTGLVVSQKDPEALANAIIRLINDTEYAQTLAEEAKIKATEMFDINKNIRELETLLLK